MNRAQAEQYVGNPVYLQFWPFTNGVYTSKGVDLHNYGVGQDWQLLKVTNGEKRIIDAASRFNQVMESLDYTQST